MRQGCILSLYLFNLYAEMIMRTADLQEETAGVKIGGLNINNLKYADDTTLLAETKEDLEKLIRKVKGKSAKSGLHLNIKKTKVMTTEDTAESIVDNEEIDIITTLFSSVVE